jgi:hypothetical protein
LLVPASPATLPIRPKGLPEKQLPGDADVLSGKSVRYTGAPLRDAPQLNPQNNPTRQTHRS